MSSDNLSISLEIDEPQSKSWFVKGDSYHLLRQWMEMKNIPFSTIVTSPPYFGCRDYLDGKNNLGDFHSGSSQLGHEDTPFNYIRNLCNIFGKAVDANYLRSDGSLWIVIGDSFARRNYTDSIYPNISKGEAICIDSLLTQEMRRNGWKIHQKIIWNKPSVPPSGAVKKRCNPSHEYILVFYRTSIRWYPGNIREEGKTKAGTIMPPVGGKKYGDYTRQIISDGKRCRQDVWTICPSRSKTSHVAPFPDDIPSLAILATTEPGELVCDCFAGTRTTERIAMSLKRSCVSFDIIEYNTLSK